MTEPTTVTRCTLADFTTGLFAGLALNGVRVLNLDGMDAAGTKAFQAWSEEAEAENIDIRFYIKQHSIHGDAPELRRGVKEAVYLRGLGFFEDGSILHIKIAREDAELYLKSVPGSVQLWRNLALNVLKELGL